MTNLLSTHASLRLDLVNSTVTAVVVTSLALVHLTGRLVNRQPGRSGRDMADVRAPHTMTNLPATHTRLRSGLVNSKATWSS